MRNYKTIVRTLASKILYDKVEDAINRHYYAPIKRAYWWCKYPNFGDMLTPSLLMRYGIQPVYANFKYADIIGVGTQLHRIHHLKDGCIIWGTGMKRDSDRCDFSKQDVVCIRGYKTLERITTNQLYEPYVGDPGILVCDLPFVESDKLYDLGFIPHFDFKFDTQTYKWLEKHKDKILLIDIKSEPSKFLHELSKCRNIFSSSLHALCAAESLRIPCKSFLPPQSQPLFKYEDFYSAFDKKYQAINFNPNADISDIISMCELIEETKVEKIKFNLRNTLINNFSINGN
jgi:hypothetical protein